MQRFGRGLVLDERQHGLEEEHQADAQQHHGLRLRAADNGRDNNNGRSHRGSKPRHQRQVELRLRNQLPLEHDGGGAAKRGGRRNAEGKRLSQRVIEDGLHLRASQRQGRADEHGHHGHGQAQLPQHRARLVIQPRGIHDALHDLGRADINRAHKVADNKGHGRNQRQARNDADALPG